MSDLHNDAPNGRYVRRFTDPNARPSNELDQYDEPTQRRITELVTWMDCEDLISEAERALRAESDRLARWEQARGLRGLGAVIRVSSNDPYHGKRFYTRAEAVDMIRPEFDSFRDYVRSMARGSFGHDKLREALVEVIEHFDHLDDAVVARFGLPSPRAEAHPELGDEPPAEWPVVNGQSPANRNANDPSWRMDARPGVHRSSP